MKKIKYLFLSLALMLFVGLVTETFAAPNYVKTREQLRQFFGIPLDLKQVGILNQIILALDQNKVAMQQERANFLKPTVTLISSSAVQSDIEGLATYKINFKVYAREDIYLPKQIVRVGQTNWDKVQAFAIQGSTGNTDGGMTSAVFTLLSGGVDTGTGNFKVAVGTEASFSVTVSYQAQSAGNYRMILNSINYLNNVGFGSKLTLSPDIFRTNYLNLTGASVAPDVTFVSASATSDDSDGLDTGTFSIRFKVKAVGSDMYIGSQWYPYYSWMVDLGGTPVNAAPGLRATLTNRTDSNRTVNGNYVIREGEEETLELTVSVPLGSDNGLPSGQYRLRLGGIRWDSTDVVNLSKAKALDTSVFATNYQFLSQQSKETQIANIQESIKALLEQLKSKI